MYGKISKISSVGNPKVLRNILFLVFLIYPSLSVCDVNNNCDLNINSNLTLFLTNKTNDNLVLGASCYLDIYAPNRTMITNDGAVIEESNGRYYRTLSGIETNSVGLYEVVFNCSKGSDISYVADQYEIVGMKPNDYFLMWNNTYFNNWNGWINQTWYNVVTPASTLMQNILNYLDGTLTTVISESEKVEIAQNTWNTTIVEDRVITGGAGAWKIDPATGKLTRS